MRAGIALVRARWERRSMRRPRDSSARSICATSRRRARRRRRARFAPGRSSRTAAASCRSDAARTTPTCGRATARSPRCASRSAVPAGALGDGASAARVGARGGNARGGRARAMGARGVGAHHAPRAAARRGHRRTRPAPHLRDAGGRDRDRVEARVRGAGRERRAAGGVRRDERPGARAARRERCARSRDSWVRARCSSTRACSAIG